MKGEARIVRRVNLVVNSHAGILHDPVHWIGVLLEELLDRVGLGQCPADAADTLAQIMPPTI